MDKLGPMARTAEDCGLVLAAVAGSDPEGPERHGPAFRARRAPLAAATGSGCCAGTLDRTQPEVRGTSIASLDVLREIGDWSRRARASRLSLGRDGRPRCSTPRRRARSSRCSERPGHPAHLARGPGRRVRGPGRAGARLPARPPASGGRRRRRWTACCRAWTRWPRPRCRPWRGRSTSRWTRHTRSFPAGPTSAGAANLCGVPALFLMNGTGEAGLPTSLQLTGRALSEATLLEIGMHYQARTKFHRQRPPGL